MRTKPSAFVRPRAARIASVASVGTLVGLSLFATAAPANAVTSADCNSANTVNANASTPGTVADIQTLLNSSTPIICLIGTFAVPSAMAPNTAVTFFGEPSATFTATTDRMLDSEYPITVENMSFIGGRGADFGGAIFTGDSVTAINSTFDDNTAGNLGGAIFGYSMVDVESSTFVDNSSDFGGAVYSGNGPVTVRDSTFSHNSASVNGGAVYAFDVVTVSGSTFDMNTSGSGGAAIQSQGPASTITNSTFTRNGSIGAGATGGALLIRGGSITQSTFFNNAAPAAGGQAIFADEPLTLLGNIFASSTPTDPQLAVTGRGLMTDNGGNVFSTAKATETLITAPAASSKFGKSVASIFPSTTLGNHGGPTKTLAIGAESAARGMVTTGTLPVDQRGKTRTSPADAGAYEYIVTSTASAGLPITGIDPSWLFAVAASLIAAGALAFGAGRRQLRRRTSRS